MKHSAISLEDMTAEQADTGLPFIFLSAEYASSTCIFDDVFATIEAPTRLAHRGPLFIPFSCEASALEAYTRILLDIERHRPDGMNIDLELVGCGPNCRSSFH